MDQRLRPASLVPIGFVVEYPTGDADGAAVWVCRVRVRAEIPPAAPCRSVCIADTGGGPPIYRCQVGASIFWSWFGAFAVMLSCAVGRSSLSGLEVAFFGRAPAVPNALSTLFIISDWPLAAARPPVLQRA